MGPNSEQRAVERVRNALDELALSLESLPDCIEAAELYQEIWEHIEERSQSRAFSTSDMFITDYLRSIHRLLEVIAYTSILKWRAAKNNVVTMADRRNGGRDRQRPKLEVVKPCQ